MPTRRKIPGLKVVEKDGEKTYWLDYTYLKCGIRKRKITRVGTNRKLALRKLAKATNLIAEDRIDELEKKEQVYFRDFSKTFLEMHSRHKRSYNRDEGIIRHLNGHFGDVLLNQITQLDVEQYRKNRKDTGISNSTVNREVSLLKTMFNRAMRWKKGQIKENPAQWVKKLEEPPAIVRYLDNDERERLLKACRHLSRATNLYEIIVVALCTGMRAGEIFNLKWKDLDSANRLIHIEQSKSGKRRDIRMNGLVYETLYKGGLKKGEYVFYGHKGRHIQTVRTAFKAALKNANIKNFRLHDCRHTFASYWMMSGGDIYTLSKILGHSSVTVTERYAHLSKDFGKETMEMVGSWTGKTNERRMKDEGKEAIRGKVPIRK